MKRRSFIKGAAASAAAAPFLLDGMPVRATSPLRFLAQMPQAALEDRILIICQLFGGNDGLNTVVPAQDPEYYKIRENIAVPEKQCWNGLGNLYLNPALSWGQKGGIADLLMQGYVAVVQGIGYPNPNLSHFRSTDIWLSGINDSNPDVRLDTGWVGRFLEQKYPNFPASLPEHPLAINFGGFSLALMSSKGRMGIEVNNPAGQVGVGSMTDALDTDAAGTNYELEYAFVADIAARSNKYAQAVKDAYNAGRTKLKGNYQNEPFGSQMAATAALIAGGLRSSVYVLSMGGYDTHVSQTVPGQNVSGTHPTLLYRFSDAIANFMYDMIQLEMGDRVIGMSVSEFGRRPYENGSFGTDHGSASVQFIFGTQVNSGVFGKQPNLKDLNENGDLLFQVDYREVYTEILTEWFGASLADTRTILQKDDLYPIDVIKTQKSGAQTEKLPTEFVIRSVFPNPFGTTTKIEFSLPEQSYVMIDIASIDGKLSRQLFSRELPSGIHRIPLEVDLPNGAYMCTVRSTSGAVSTLLRCYR
jgi:uncharacterized protein (DUF1501 family)